MDVLCGLVASDTHSEGSMRWRAIAIGDGSEVDRKEGEEGSTVVGSVSEFLPGMISFSE